MTPTLERVDDRLWLAEGEIVSFYGFPYPTRSVVVRLADGGLWVWSPIRLTDGLRAEIDGLGHVAHLVESEQAASPPPRGLEVRLSDREALGAGLDGKSLSLA